MPGLFSAAALRGLLASGLPVAGLLLPGQPGGLPIVQRQSPTRRSLALAGAAGQLDTLDLAWQGGVPVFAAGQLAHPRTLATLAALRPDLIAVACFPRRLPAALLALAPLGGVNLHPSLLPAGRGPAPRFWAFRRGLAETGVTAHVMTPALDAGPILAQATFALPDGMTGLEFDRRAGSLGGDLLAEVVWPLAAGRATPRPQDETLATYDPWPEADDYLVTPDRPARWAYNFMRGVAGDGGPLALLAGEERWPAREALGFDEAGRLETAWRRVGDEVWLRCAPGVLHARLVARE